MTNGYPQTADDFRLAAAREFVRTMIFVDDEVPQNERSTTKQVVKSLRTPVTPSISKEYNEDIVPDLKISDKIYDLDVKQLIDSAMEKGLICSVLRPLKDDKFEGRVAKAAEFADIVCLDWEIFDDGGERAKNTIKAIIERDKKLNGRSRLIAIYTRDRTNPRILEQILKELPLDVKNNRDATGNPFICELDTGARIVCLFKGKDNEIGMNMDELVEGYKHQVDVKDLPERLLEEFAKLSRGLMSNVALATIASIRQSTHHVLSSLARDIDGAYFHHRALLENPEDAEMYAVEIVLSELKGTIDKQKIADNYASKKAIKPRINEIAEDEPHLTLNCGEDSKSTFCVNLADSIKAVTEGIEIAKAQINVENLTKKNLENYLSSLFANGWQEANSQMLELSALTSLRSHPKNYLYGNGTRRPQLGMGTVIRNQKGKFFMCLQADCDTVRIERKQSFIFVELENSEKTTRKNHIFTVPDPDSKQYIKLRVSGNSYRALKLIKFSPDENSNTVLAKFDSDCNRFLFTSAVGKKAQSYCWVADVKRRRAMRSAEGIVQILTRLGFDEFAPFRGTEN